MSFNLADEPWLPVLRHGVRVQVSLGEALLGAHELDGLAWDQPLQTAAAFRQVLLPAYLDLAGLPATDDAWAARWKDGQLPPAAIVAYMHAHHDRFELFHPLYPFAQVTGLTTGNGEVKPASLLDPAVATGNNVPLFSAFTDDTPPALTPAQAALSLLSVLCWDTAAIKSGAVGDPKASAGKTTGNHTGPLGQLGILIPEGPTLFATLLLNTPIVPAGLRATDRPHWRADPAGPPWQVRPPLGLLDLLTWPSRRVRLIPQQTEHGQEVRTVVLCAGDRLAALPEYEPHTAWRRVDKPAPDDPPRRAVRHQAGRELWRGMDALLATKVDTPDGKSTSALLGQIADLRAGGHLPTDLPLQVRAVGVIYGNQSAVVEDTVIDALPLPVLALATGSEVHQVLLEVVTQARDLQQAANRLQDDLRRATGGDKMPWDKGSRIGDMLLHRLTGPVHRLLAGLQREPERATEGHTAWTATARALALALIDPAVATVPPSAFGGRDGAIAPSLAVRRYQVAVTDSLGPVPESLATVEVLS